MRNPNLGLTCFILTTLAAFIFTVHINTLYATPYHGSDNSLTELMVENNNNNAPSVLHLLPSNDSNANSNSDINTGSNTSTTTNTNTDTNGNTHSHSNNNNNNPPSKTNPGSSDVHGGGAAGGSANSIIHSNDKTNQKNHRHVGIRDKNSNSDHDLNNNIQNRPENKIKHKLKVGDIPFP